MPAISKYKCNKCGFMAAPEGWGYYMYVEDDKGKRIICPHPMEGQKIEEVLGEDASDELRAERTGINSDCVCLDCLYRFIIDIDKDKKECPKCKSEKIKTIDELIGKSCPKCKKGIIDEVWTGIIC